MEENREKFKTCHMRKRMKSIHKKTGICKIKSGNKNRETKRKPMTE